MTTQRLLFIFGLCLILANCTFDGKKTSKEKMDIDDNPIINLADPTIFYHEGTYYLYGTVARDANQGFLVYTSPNLQDWEGPVGKNNGYALRKEDVYGEKGFWAPQIFQYQDSFYIAYTANEQIAIAKSDSPLGPFTQSSKDSLAAPMKQIDPFVFIDDDGKKYLYHVRLTKGNRLFVAEMEDDLSAIKPETLQECLSAEDPWENTADSEWPVSEGPTILKHQGLYYLIYSANDFRNPDYAVGFAVSENPMGPWKKYDKNPIIDRTKLGANGTGHGDIVRDETGRMHYVFHTHQSDKEVHPRITAIINIVFGKNHASDTMDVMIPEKESFTFLKLSE